MKPIRHPSIDIQMASVGSHHWAVARLIKLAESLPSFEADIRCININHTFSDITLRELCGHCIAINEANKDYPIILDEDGEIMDGRHRLMRAIIDGDKTITAVRFDVNPIPCKVDGV